MKNQPLRGLPKPRGHWIEGALEIALPPMPAYPVTDLTVETHEVEGFMGETIRPC